MTKGQAIAHSGMRSCCRGNRKIKCACPLRPHKPDMPRTAGNCGSAVVVMSRTPVIGDSRVVTGSRRDICKPST
jgi:hypothetical protein